MNNVEKFDKLLKIIYKFICVFIPIKSWRSFLKDKCTLKYYLNSRTNKVILKGVGKWKGFILKRNLKHIYYKNNSRNNTITIELPISNIRSFLKSLNIYFCCSNNSVYISKNVIVRNLKVTFCDKESNLYIGENTSISTLDILLVNQNVAIGKNCMFATGLRIITDGHSIIDVNTGDVLNKPKHDLIIGDRVWICDSVTLNKNTIIPNGCIVANGAIVTKEFTEENCVIGGVPAKVIKTGCTWNVAAPTLYKK